MGLALVHVDVLESYLVGNTGGVKSQLSFKAEPTPHMPTLHPHLLMNEPGFFWPLFYLLSMETEEWKWEEPGSLNPCTVN